MNIYTGLILYLIVSTFLSILGGDNFSFLNYIVTFFVLYISINFPNYIRKKLLKVKDINLYLLTLVMLVFSNIILNFLTDNKDFSILFILQICIGFFSIFMYFLKKIILDKNIKISMDILIIYSSFFILIFIERLINSIEYFNSLNLDIFHLLIIIILWDILCAIIVYLKINT